MLEELRLLSNYGQRLGKYLQLVLVGQPELAARLRRPSLRQFNQRVAARSVLGRLSFAEAHEYVGYRLRAKGGRSRDIFDPNALAYLLRHSNGVPRRINVLCHNAMLLAFSSGGPQVDLKTARTTVREHGESLLSGTAATAALSVAHHWVKPAPATVAMMALLVAVLYGFRAGSKTIANAKTATAIAQTSMTRVVREIPAEAARMQTAEPPPAVRPNDARPPRATHSLAAAQTFSADSPPQADAGAIVPPASPPIAATPAESRIVTEQAQQNENATDSSASPADADTQRPTVIVKYGDTLERLALQHLGSHYALNTLIDANPQIADINRIYPGQKVYLSDSAQNEKETGHKPAGGAKRSPSERSTDIWQNADSLGPSAAEVVP